MQIPRLLCTILFFSVMSIGSLFGQCSSLYNTPEFPIATHPADQHTNSWGVNLFTPTEFGTGAVTISGIQVYVDNSFGATTYPNQRVYMRHTTTSSYPNANYPGTAGWTYCYSGTYNFPMSGLYSIVFNQSNFSYNGTDNVEILFENRSNLYDWNEPWFRRTPSYGAGNYRSKWNGDFGWNYFPGSGYDGSAVRLTYTLSLTAQGGNGCGSILPVMLIRFNGYVENEMIGLEWETGEGQQPLHYIVEHSDDAETFDREIAVVEADPDRRVFKVNDRSPLPGRNYYRLVQEDSDGNRTASGVIVVNNDLGEGRFSAVFTPDRRLDAVAEVPHGGSYRLRMTDMSGRLLMDDEVELHRGYNRIRPALKAPATGIYAIWLEGSGGAYRARALCR